MFEQRSVYKKVIDGHEIIILCGNDLPLGVFHDFLMDAKGWAVGQMVAAQAQEKEPPVENPEVEILDGE